MKEKFNSAIKQTAEKMRKILNEKGSVYVAIDGNCGGGKSTFAKVLSKEFDCNVFHIDDFYLPIKFQTAKKLVESAGNIDRTRFINEVLFPAKNGEKFSYKAFDCKTQKQKAPQEFLPKTVVITEGSYSCHPDFFGFYDLHIFISITPEKQKERIISRNGEGAFKTFAQKWIPFEEKYFKDFKIKNKCDIVFEFN